MEYPLRLKQFQELETLIEKAELKAKGTEVDANNKIEIETVEILPSGESSPYDKYAEPWDDDNYKYSALIDNSFSHLKINIYNNAYRSILGLFS